VRGALDENYGLRTGNLEAPATTLASQHVVDADHVIAGFLKTGPILHPAEELPFSCALTNARQTLLASGSADN
jgi:hypothetical protein